VFCSYDSATYRASWKLYLRSKFPVTDEKELSLLVGKISAENFNQRLQNVNEKEGNEKEVKHGKKEIKMKMCISQLQCSE
jgi:hypothetical protein